jgi:hypothetical protein
MANNFGMEQLVDHLRHILTYQFSRDVSRVYFGDLGEYIPANFGGSDKEPKAIIALNPKYSRPHPGGKTAGHEYRDLGVDIIVMVNVTSQFTANPDEAYGERKLVRLTTEIYEFLNKRDNTDLKGLVQYTKILDIDWEWQQRGDTAVRAAGIEYEARVIVPRN